MIDRDIADHLLGDDFCSRLPDEKLSPFPLHKFVSLLERALLHKSNDGQISPFPGRTYPTGSVTGMPRAV